jgi:16S rRNA (uracil1498-N3)-methyltransferase
MNLFYTPGILTTCELNEQESHHAVKVLRMKTGDTIFVVDGTGFFIEAKIMDANPRCCKVTILNQTRTDDNPNSYKLHMAVAPTKNIDRFEWFIEKAVEIGVHEITPILCDNSERKVIKTERIERIAVAAMKQSLKATLPVFNQLIPFNNFITGSNNKYNKKLIAHCYPESRKNVKEVIDTQFDKNILILIGPEGDFSKEEVSFALNNNFEPISLGTSRLRTETAGLAACHSVYILFQ